MPVLWPQRPALAKPSRSGSAVRVGPAEWTPGSGIFPRAPRPRWQHLRSSCRPGPHSASLGWWPVTNMAEGKNQTKPGCCYGCDEGGVLGGQEGACCCEFLFFRCFHWAPGRPLQRPCGPGAEGPEDAGLTAGFLGGLFCNWGRGGAGAGNLAERKRHWH